MLKNTSDAQCYPSITDTHCYPSIRDAHCYPSITQCPLLSFHQWCQLLSIFPSVILTVHQWFFSASQSSSFPRINNTAIDIANSFFYNISSTQVTHSFVDSKIAHKDLCSSKKSKQTTSLVLHEHVPWKV